MSELIKLLLIIGIGVVVLVVGFLQVKKKKESQLDSMQSYSGALSKNASYSPNISTEEEKAKNYISQYKETYPRESLKVSLVNSGNSEGDVNSWLDKYL
ncbi:MAG: hypothetical protein HRU03_00785 [Nanoarchaeales archaeon]|nr:hypothetical protein [Nanoarchaeales archaeon]